MPAPWDWSKRRLWADVGLGSTDAVDAAADDLLLH
jgi:hypothetical protein